LEIEHPQILNYYAAKVSKYLVLINVANGSKKTKKLPKFAL